MVYTHLLVILQENAQLSITKQSRLIEVCVSKIAEILVKFSVDISINPECITWPGGNVFSVPNDPLASKRHKGKPLKKSIDTLMSSTVLKAREEIPAINNDKVLYGKFSELLFKSILSNKLNFK